MQTIERNTRPLITIHRELQQIDASDQTVNIDDLRMDSDGLLRVGNTDAFELADHAVRQIGGRLRCPGDYLLRCPAELRARNVNHWLREQGTRDLLLRKHGRTVRAILSDRYSVVDDVDVTERLMAVYGEDAEARIRRDVTHTTIEMVGRSLRVSDPAADGLLRSGIAVTNSEVGAGALKVFGLLYRSFCLNGMIMGTTTGTTNVTGVVRRHVGEVGEVLAQLTADLNGGAAMLDAAAAAFAKSAEIFVPGNMAGKVFDKITERYELTKAQRAAMGEAFAAEPGDRMYHVLNALTRAGTHSGLPVDAAQRLSFLGGSMLDQIEKGSYHWLEVREEELAAAN